MNSVLQMKKTEDLAGEGNLPKITKLVSKHQSQDLNLSLSDPRTIIDVTLMCLKFSILFPLL